MSAYIPSHIRLGDSIPAAACGQTVPRGTEPTMLGIRIRTNYPPARPAWESTAHASEVEILGAEILRATVPGNMKLHGPIVLVPIRRQGTLPRQRADTWPKCIGSRGLGSHRSAVTSRTSRWLLCVDGRRQCDQMPGRGGCNEHTDASNCEHPARPVWARPQGCPGDLIPL